MFKIYNHIINFFVCVVVLVVVVVSVVVVNGVETGILYCWIKLRNSLLHCEFTSSTAIGFKLKGIGECGKIIEFCLFRAEA